MTARAAGGSGDRSTASGEAELDVIWHQVECGSYAADLAVWSRLAREAGGPVLELGAGAGRVALRLAREGFEVVALDSSPTLLGELDRRARADRVDVEAVTADARELDLARRFAAIIAPMQFVHLLDGEAGRRRALRTAAAHLAPGGVMAAALLAAEPAAARAHGPSPLPDVAEGGRWVYSSLPLEVRPLAGGLEVVRLRQIVAPSGQLSERVSVTRLDTLDATAFEAEAAAAGLRSRERLEVPATDDHLGSVVCVLEAAR